ncbi:hypothetical protein DBR23_15545 [Acidovorax sp. HMWF018]|uniref:hypothetical protein n=1 Tax=Acidovorax sp. HMWF018 TaxID=2056855 RepID=UPI000D367E79|nr:hypothetical protein [Acidovorax sp. HMWF018]PTT38066.1 hypothetical protein DBR23_15545 [Acidovorax sp. HMWF018]
MYRSSRFVSLVALACVAAASAMSAAVDRVASAVSYGIDRLLSAWVEPFQLQTKAPGQEKPRVALVAAKAFVLRVLKRRPTVHPSWRMCPSI